MYFKVICNDKPIEFNLSKSMAEFKVSLGRKLIPDSKWRIQKQEVEDTNWHEREEERFKSGKLKPPLWHTTPWARRIEKEYKHFTAIEGENLSYFPSNSHGFHDQRQRASVSGYLKKYSGLADDTIRKWVEHHYLECGGYEYIIATKPKDILNYYRVAAPACMSHPADHYPCKGKHPVEAYGEGSDFSLLVLKKGDKYVGRTLIVEKDKVHMRTYGDQNKLKLMLSKLGYKNAPPYGYKIKAVKLGDATPYIATDRQEIGGSTYMTPYVDNAYWMELQGEHFVIVRGNPPKGKKTYYMCRTPGGIAQPARPCPHCRQLATTFFSVDGRAYARCQYCDDGRYHRDHFWSTYITTNNAKHSYSNAPYHPDVELSSFLCIKCRKRRRPRHMSNHEICILCNKNGFDMYVQRNPVSKAAKLYNRLYAPRKKKTATFTVTWTVDSNSSS